MDRQVYGTHVWCTWFSWEKCVNTCENETRTLLKNENRNGTQERQPEYNNSFCGVRTCIVNCNHFFSELVVSQRIGNRGRPTLTTTPTTIYIYCPWDFRCACSRHAPPVERVWRALSGINIHGWGWTTSNYAHCTMCPGRKMRMHLVRKAKSEKCEKCAPATKLFRNVFLGRWHLHVTPWSPCGFELTCGLSRKLTDGLRRKLTLPSNNWRPLPETYWLSLPLTYSTRLLRAVQRQTAISLRNTSLFRMLAPSKLSLLSLLNVICSFFLMCLVLNGWRFVYIAKVLMILACLWLFKSICLRHVWLDPMLFALSPLSALNLVFLLFC